MEPEHQSSAAPIPVITVRLILVKQNPVRENLAQSTLLEGLRSTLAGAKSDLTPGNLSKISDTMDKMAALDMNFAASPAAG